MSSTPQAGDPATAGPSSRGPGRSDRRPDLDSLYCINADGSRNKIHTADVRGRYQRRKWVLWAILIAIYLVVPWILIGGKPAFLIDIPRRHFYLLGNTFNAQDFWLAFFVVTGIGFSLIVVSAMWGRVWCGYGCPQTVFLEGVYRRVERFFEGNAAKRKKLDAAGVTPEKVLRRTGKYATYLALSVVLSHTFLGYFMPVREVVKAMAGSPSEHPSAFLFVLVFTAIIFFNFAWFREQLCIVICPYGRLQSVLYDQDTVNVGYDKNRGEPRGKHNVEGRGDCIDCHRCVAVCPTGIDIRNGTQLECVGCANCIDACDEVMDKLGQPRGLVRYDSLRGFEQGQRRFWRPRVLLYAVLLLIGIAVFAVAITKRTAFEANVVRVQGSAYTLDGETVTNAFVIHLVNKLPATTTFSVEAIASAGVEWTIPLPSVTLESLADQRLPVLAKFQRGRLKSGTIVQLVVTSEDERRTVDVKLLGP
ncbi:MAG: cytochrome c oxidase accessory protein CcoG [Planctomycetota bacterium]